LANKYPDLIYALLVDRTFGELLDVSDKRLIGCSTKSIFNFVSCYWRTQNDYNFSRAKCFKILTCDPKDDVVDNMASVAVLTAKQLALRKYSENKWKQLHEALKFVFDIEGALYEKMPNKNEE